MNMLRKLLLSLILICVIKCEQSSSYPVEHLHVIIDRTAEYFKNISNAYKESNIDITKDIDHAIDMYMRNTTKAISQRQKRSVHNDLKSIDGVRVLKTFDKGIFINLPDVQDIVFFSIQDGNSILRLAAAIDSSNILLYQLADDKLQTVAMYPQSNGKRIIVNTYSTDMLIVVEKSTDEILILRLGKNKNGTYELYFKQGFEIPEVIHMNMWFGMNRLYLGVVSDSSVIIYVWLGEHFDKIDTLYFKARKLLPFQHKSFMHIVAIGSITKIFRFSVRSNKFVETQELHGTRDANSFYFKEGHFEERFLLLADDSSIILYKEMYDRFVPFQSFITTAHIYSLITESTVILLFVEDHTAEIYQYNGWRFLRLHEKLSNIRQIRQIQSYGEDALILQNQDKEWNLLKPIWTVKKTWQILQNEINSWCLETKRRMSQRNSVKMPDLKNPVTMSNVHIGQLHVRNMNNYNVKELMHLTQRYKKICTKLNLVNSTLAQAIAVEKSKYIILHGKKISVKCRRKCHVHHIKAEIKPTEFRKLEPTNKILEFNSLKVKTMNNWKCPVPNFDLEDIFVKKSINGILMRNLQEETLKIFGDQTLSGEHTFLNLYATNISMPLNIATYNTTQIIRIKEAKVKELYLTEDEFFLPLNATTTTMTGSITAAKVRVTGIINLKGGISGKGREKLTPLKEFSVPLTLLKDCFLQNVTFRNLIRINNIIRTRGLSLKEILENSISLNSNIQEHIMLSNDKIHWENVTLLNHKNWVTKNSTDAIVIFGTKFANNIILTNFTYANLPIPKLTVPLCAIEVVTPEIRTSLITMDNLFIKNLNVAHVLGAYNLNNTIFNSMATLQNINFSTKLFTGPVFVHNILVSNITGTDLIERFHMNDWIGINRLKGPINVTNLDIDNLRTPVIFNFSLPTIVRNVVVKADSEIGKINDVNISSFMENALKVDDIIFLDQVTFADGFRSDYVYTSHSTLNLSNLDNLFNFNLHSKRISKDLETNVINVPDNFEYFTSDIPSTFIIQGSATFLTEPTVKNVQNMSITKLSERIWMSNEDSFISGSNMYIKNITILADTYINEDVENSLNVPMWFNLSNRLFSKTKQQYITAISSFKNVKISAIIATNNSVLHSSDPNFEDLLTNSLMRNITQVVEAVWHFEELDTGDLKLNNKLNDINLDTDIVRHDAKQNIVTGKKTITNLITENLWSYDNYFSHWANNALTQKGRKLSVIKGRKTFKKISLNNLSVNGTVSGRKIEDALLKSGNQTVYGIKRIEGHINAPSFIVNSTVNDVNLTQLMDIQVKKHKAVQIINTEIDFKNKLNIFGNVTVNGFYQTKELININNTQNKLNAILNRTTEIMDLTEDIKTALQNHAAYINKFEVIDENLSKVISHSETENVIVLNNTCLCEPKNISSLCNDTKLLNIMYGTNSSIFRMMKLIMLNDAVFVIMVTSDFVTIYSYVPAEQQLYQKAELYVPNILQASVEIADNSLWIILQLSEQTLILHYEVWNEFKQYILPSSDMLLTSKTPNNQLFLIRSDGIWNLGGLFHPQHIFTMSLKGKIKTFALDDDYYITLTTENSTITLKSHYVGN